MITTQKITSLGFAYYDGSKLQLSEDQQRKAVRYETLTQSETHQLECFLWFERDRPSPMEFFGYLLNFQTLLTGPLCFYNDYIEFINGQNITKHRVGHLFLAL
jgi:hypothetical protein